MLKKSQKSTRTIQRERDAKVWFYAIVFELSPDADIETVKLMHTVFKKDGKSYYVMSANSNIAAVKNGMYSQGYGEYKIIQKLGKDSNWAKGEWVS